MNHKWELMKSVILTTIRYKTASTPPTVPISGFASLGLDGPIVSLTFSGPVTVLSGYTANKWSVISNGDKKYGVTVTQGSPTVLQITTGGVAFEGSTPDGTVSFTGSDIKIVDGSGQPLAAIVNYPVDFGSPEG